MTVINTWLHKHLDAAGRLGETLFGLIMALGFTGAVRLGLEEADNRQLFVAILGCNIAWGVVDGVMFVMTQMFERGRKARVARDVVNAPSEESAMKAIDNELGGPLLATMPAEVRASFYRNVIEVLRREKPPRAGIQRGDIMGGLAVAVIIILSTLPVVVPYLIFGTPEIAVRVSHAVGLSLLFVLGVWWGRMVGSSPWKMGLGLTAVGLAMVLVTIALGG